MNIIEMKLKLKERLKILQKKDARKTLKRFILAQKIPILASFTLFIMSLALLASFSLGCEYQRPKLEYLGSRLEDTERELFELEATISELLQEREEKRRLEETLSAIEDELLSTKTSLSSALDELAGEKRKHESALKELESLKESAKENITILTEQIQAQNRTISFMNYRVDAVKKLLKKLDRDRSLLVYLRMDLPDSRGEARDYWDTIWNITDQSLRPAVSEVIAYTDEYFDWLEAMPRTLPEWYEWLGSYPPNYDSAVRDFRKDALLAVIIHVDSIIDLFEE